MHCKRCGSSFVNIQAVTTLKRKRHSIFYWLLIGWWFELIMWIFFTLPWLIIKILKPAKYKSKVHKEAICQNCGYSWRV